MKKLATVALAVTALLYGASVLAPSAAFAANNCADVKDAKKKEQCMKKAEKKKAPKEKKEKKEKKKAHKG